MRSEEPMWEMRNAIGERAVCCINPTNRGYLLVVKRADKVDATEVHMTLTDALVRAEVIYCEFSDAGWHPSFEPDA